MDHKDTLLIKKLGKYVKLWMLILIREEALRDGNQDFDSLKRKRLYLAISCIKNCPLVVNGTRLQGMLNHVLILQERDNSFAPCSN